MINNKARFLIILILSIFLSLITGGKTFYKTSLFLLIILGTNYFIVWHNIKKIDSNFVINKETHTVGEELKFKYILVNKSIIVLYRLKVKLILSKEFSNISSEVENIYFKANQVIELRRSFICEKRGYYEIGKLEVEARDLFDIFVKGKTLDKSINIKVYPKLIDIDCFYMNLKGFLGKISSNKSSVEDFTNIRSIREYKIGDNPKNIHYKLSARADKTFIKEYSESNYLDLSIIVDGVFRENTSNYSEELCVSISLSIAKFVLEHSSQVDYRLTNKSGLNLALNSIDSYYDLLEILLSSEFDGESSLDYCLGNNFHNIRSTSGLLIITRHISQALVDRLVSLCNFKTKIALYIVTYNESKGLKLKDMVLTLEENGVELYFIENLSQL